MTGQTRKVTNRLPGSWIGRFSPAVCFNLLHAYKAAIHENFPTKLCITRRQLPRKNEFYKSSQDVLYFQLLIF